MTYQKKNLYERRSFIRLISGAGLGLAALSGKASPQNQTISLKTKREVAGKRVGIIGLDTSHSREFTKIINTGMVKSEYKVVAAYPHGSPDIPSAVQMKPDITAAVKDMGVEIVDSIPALLKKADVILLETNDGRPHYEQALPVLKARKRMFIDKPLAADMKDVQRIFEAAKKYKTPVFSSSALRFDESVQKAANGAIGKITGADVYTPAEIDPNHLDLAWYAIHGVEMLYTLMGTGCASVSRFYENDSEVTVGVWRDGRIGTVRGIRKGGASIAGTAFGEKGIMPVGPFHTYVPLIDSIIRFFDTGTVPVTPEETTEMFAFMHAADESRRQNGKRIQI